MAHKVFRKGGYFYIVDTVTGRERDGLTENVRVTRATTTADVFFVNGVNDWSNETRLTIGNIQDENGDVYTLAQFITFYQGASSKDVNVQDQTSPAIIAYMSSLEEETALTTTVAIDDYDITVDDATGFTIGKYVSIFNVAANRFYLGTVLSTSGNPVTLDTPMDFAYTSGSFVTAGERNMNTDGSSTPVIFGLRNTDVAIGASFDITRLIFTCLADTTVDLSKFGDIVGGLTNGMVLRRVDGVTRNLFNVKTNSDLANIMLDFDIQAAQGNQQDGFIARITFAGQNKMGVSLRLAPGEDIQMLNQDNLTTLGFFGVVAEGHEVVQ